MSLGQDNLNSNSKEIITDVSQYTNPANKLNQNKIKKINKQIIQNKIMTKNKEIIVIQY
jgi:hypothetical protein